MKNLVAISALFLGAVAQSSAQEPPPVPVGAAPAEPAPVSLPARVATIFAQNAIISTQEGQKASAALNAKYAPRKEEFNRKQTELQSLRDQLKRGLATMSPEGKARLNAGIDAKNKEMQRLSEDSRSAAEEEEGAMLQQLGDKLLGVIQSYATEKGYAVVIDVSVPNGPVLWVSPSVDITNDVVKLYDKTHPVAANPAAVLPTAPPVKK